MSHRGKIQLTFIFTARPDQVAEGDRIFASHAKWMAESHYRNGELALLRYNVTRGPEASNPLDPTSARTENTCFVLMEVYESEAGLADHWKQGAETWEHFNDFVRWASSCQVSTLQQGTVVHSLWEAERAEGASA